MRQVSLTIKNYRCFSDENPLRLNLTGEAIAFIGANNSGKSAALKFLYEYRELWAGIRKLVEHPAPTQHSLTIQFIYPLTVDDPDRVFHFNNNREMTIEFEFANISATYPVVNRIWISIPRENATTAKITMESSEKLHFENIITGNPQGKWGLSQHGNRYVELDGMEIFEVIESAFYIGAFRNAINQTGNNQDYYDIRVGNDFVKLWDDWKSGTGINSTKNAKKILAITQAIKEMYNFS